MSLLAITSDTWIVTGLGFGIVLALLCCLVFILKFFGWTMQKVTPSQTKKAPKDKKTETDDVAAVAMAIYLAKHAQHDEPTSMITFDKRDTAWNPKSEGFNNIGF